MRESVFQKVVSLLLCAVLILGFLPGAHVHAEEAGGDAGLSDEQKQAVLNRQLSWYFPLPEEYFDDIREFAGCRGNSTPDVLHGTTNPNCTHSDEHAAAATGSDSMYINVDATQPVYAPASGTVYFGTDEKWGSVAVLEVPVDGNFSYYILLGQVQQDGSLASGSAVSAGAVIGSTSGEFRMSALMNYSGMGQQVASAVSVELSAVESFGWLVGDTGTGLICVNPSSSTATQYPNFEATMSYYGPVTYSFVPPQSSTTETTVPETTVPETTVPETTVPETTVPETTVPETTVPETTVPEITVPETTVPEITVPETTVPETTVPETTVPETTVTEPPVTVHQHVFDQMIPDERYLAYPATCTEPAQYYYSCACGAVGTETFAYGEAKGHTFSDQWNYDETYHWHPATCEHSDEKGDFGPHRWDDGVITQNAGHNVNGEKLYTCLDCGYQKTEIIPGQPHEYNQEVVDEKYLASPATCTEPARYYYSCVCGAAGTETFAYGSAKGHTYSDQWSYNELQHWHAATCEHKDLKAEVGDHVWNPGVITTQPTASSKGVMTYTCAICGYQKTEEIPASAHQHTFSTAWQGNSTYHWHPATCEHTNVVSGLGEHQWDAGVVTVQPTHTTTGQKVYTCTVCGMTKTETLNQTHTFDQMIASPAYLKSEATCTSPAVYYKSCTCGAKGTETFTYGSALGHTASGTWGKDANYHWNVCSRCGAKGDLVAHSFDSAGKCTVCGYSKEESHVHSSHLTRVPAKAATCTTDGNIAYYVCDCGAWFTDVTCTTPITDHASVVIPATGHVDQDNDGRCDVCKQRLDNTVDYQVTEGGEATWLNTSNQGMVFRSNAEYAKFDRIEVDNAAVDASNYSVSEGSTVIELSASYLKRLSLGHHTLSIVSKDGVASTGFTVKQGATSARSGNGPWGIILLLTVIVAIAIPVTFGVLYYRKKMGYND